MSFSLFGAHYNTEPTIDSPTESPIKEQQRGMISCAVQSSHFPETHFTMKWQGHINLVYVPHLHTVGILLAAFSVCVQNCYAPFERVISNRVLLELLLT